MLLNGLRRLYALAVCGGALASAGLAIAAVCGALDANLDVFAHLAPLYLAGSVAGLALALTLRGPAGRIAAIAAILGLAACGILMAPEFLAIRFPPPPPGDEDRDFKLIEFNTLSGNKRSGDALQWLLKQQADVLVLTEGAAVEDGLVRRGHYHLSCGNCYAQILTKVEPNWTNTPANWRIKPDPVSVVSLPDRGAPITILAVHRAWAIHPRVFQPEMAELARTAAKYPKGRMIIAGDFNSTPWSSARRQEDRALGLTRRTRALFTWPAERASHARALPPFPVLPIDHVYAGPGWATVRVERGPNLGSDHYPVIVTLRRLADQRTTPP